MSASHARIAPHKESPKERAAAPGRVIDVLVVDDEDDIRELIELSLLRMGLSCEGAGSLADAQEKLQQFRFRLCLTDMRLPDGDGLTLIAELQRKHPGLPVAMITAYGNMETAIRALKAGAFDFVTKPVELKTLRTLVEQALKLDPPADAGIDTPDLVGASPAIVFLRAQISKLARNQAPIFLHGESGTGKEVIARLIHSHGPRVSQAFVPVNCGAIAPELVESELFGYKRGAFTGAQEDRPGLFQAADGGTLFLDEVADLPLAAQVKLLRAIQERAVRPVGANHEEPVDVRIVSASHRSLAECVAAGTFRQDLFFRINVIELEIPPLRERREDIRALSDYLLQRLAQRDGVPPRGLTAAALAALEQCPFHGNVRELENLLERALALSEGALINANDLGLLDPGPTARILPATPPVPSPPPHSALSPTPHSAPSNGALLPADPRASEGGGEQLQVLDALERTRWNRSAAARELGLTLRQLRYRLQKWGLE